LIEGFKSGKFKKVVVLTGAGISVSAGIPDFRSPGTGLYSNLQKYDLPRPEAIFDKRYFIKKPQAFYQLADEFLDTSKYEPTLTHHFVKLLQDKDVLQMYFTQNIDNLESKINLDPKKLIQAHGANVGATCAKCGAKNDRELLEKYIKEGNVLYCKKTLEEDVSISEPNFETGEFAVTEWKKGEICEGPIKPDIVFFGEPLPGSIHKGWDFIRNKPMFSPPKWLSDEEPKPLFEDGGCDLIIVIGTALAVTPFNSTIWQVP